MEKIIQFFKNLLNSRQYEIMLRAETITETKRLNDKKYCSWYAVNSGTVDVKIFGVTLAPGEGINSQSIIATRPGDLWTEPLDIEITSPGSIRLLRTICTPIKKVKE